MAVILQVPDKDDLPATWEYLRARVDQIMYNLRAGVTMDVYMGVYTATHNFCTSQKAAGEAHRGGQGNTYRGAHLLGEDLYKHLKQYLQEHLRELRKQAEQHRDEALLRYYIREWDRYTTAAKYLNNFFRYLNRHWVKREIDEGKKDIYEIYPLHLVSWKEELFTHIHEQVMAAVLKMVEQQRNGDTIEHNMIKKVVASFVSLGMDESDSNKSTLEVYRQFFEKPFIVATRNFYQNESRQFVADNTVVEYMKKAEARLEEEKARVEMYLHADIMNPLLKTCLEVLVADHSSLLREEFQKLLDADREEDLARMYKLLQRIPGGLDPLRTRFEKHVQKTGQDAVAKLAAAGEQLEPKAYIDALLQVHSHFAHLVNVAFNGESEFVRSLDSACKEFVNRNKVCENNSTKSPELLAKYADSILKKGSKIIEDNEIEGTLMQVMTVFKFIEDKDVFQKFYTRSLAKRLVHGNSASDEAEISMIGKLKEACGFEYTNKLQRMFQDIQTSKDLNSNYKNWQQEVLDADDLKKAVDPTYSILGTGFWPMNPPNTPFIPPMEISKTYERFQTFYFEKHSGRKLTWLWQLCKGEVKANYIKNAKIPYTFQVSTYQIAILLLFNDSDRVSYEDMAKATALNKEFLDPSIQIMVKAKVILPEPDDGKTEDGTVYRLNHDFKNKKYKVNLNINVKSEQKQETEDTHKTIEEDRRLLMQSVIVRIMKSRKKMKHTLLVQETITQIKSRFTPKIADIKKSIDQLIEKEYLERLDNEELGYLA